MDVTMFKGKELIVRKRLTAFIERLFRHCGFDFRHDLFKQIVYSEIGCNTPLEEKMKNYYDAYCYLLYNHKNVLSKDILKRFFYILSGVEPDEAQLIRLVSQFFFLDYLPPLDKAIEFHLFVYKELKWKDYDEQLIVSLMFFNYILVQAGIPAVHFIRPALHQYEQRRDEYFNGTKGPLYKLLLEIVTKTKTQKKSFYKNLTPLSAREIIEQFMRDKTMLKNNYGVKNLYIFGSFAKNCQRIDSDIDLLIVFSQDISYEQKMKNVEYLSEYYFNVFNRFMDFTEIGDYVQDEIIKETARYIKIY